MLHGFCKSALTGCFGLVHVGKQLLSNLFFVSLQNLQSSHVEQDHQTICIWYCIVET